MFATWVMLIVCIAAVGACFWYVFVRQEPPTTRPTPEQAAWSRIAAAVQRAADELPADGPAHALLLTLHDMMTVGNAGLTEAVILRTDQSLQYAIGSVTEDRIARACLCEAQARMSTLRICLAEERGWFGGVAAPGEEGPEPVVVAMRRVADLVELAERAAPSGSAPALQALHKGLPTKSAPTASGILWVELEVGVLLEQLGETPAGEYLRSAARVVAEVKAKVPGAIAASWETHAA